MDDDEERTVRWKSTKRSLYLGMDEREALCCSVKSSWVYTCVLVVVVPHSFLSNT